MREAEEVKIGEEVGYTFAAVAALEVGHSSDFDFGYQSSLGCSCGNFQSKMCADAKQVEAAGHRVVSQELAIAELAGRPSAVLAVMEAEFGEERNEEEAAVNVVVAECGIAAMQNLPHCLSVSWA